MHRTTASLLSVVALVVGCGGEGLEPPPCTGLTLSHVAKADLEGEWTYRASLLREEDGELVATDVATELAPVTVRIDEQHLRFVAEDGAALARMWTDHLDVEDRVAGSGETCTRLTAVERPWHERNSVRPDLSQVLLLGDPRAHPLEDALDVEPHLPPTDAFELDLGWIRGQPERDAAGRAVRFAFLGHFRVRTCETGAPECTSTVRIGLELAR
ncbi:hypothetical protein [Sandaracinus amylolyticus]|uniref:hypothetical protein n=1 Tax=Sandaracinus amylolyticus TaxID=927083 RepID=UPI001F22DE3E|nr:hypothetical protein [Sandaracinus amylolyticus]UJR84452.1 Hypothetical protein I5071_65310 [Sandaracinus amylolyticus]